MRGHYKRKTIKTIAAIVGIAAIGFYFRANIEVMWTRFTHLNEFTIENVSEAIPEVSAAERLRDEQKFKEFMQKLEANEREIWLRKEKVQDNKTRQDVLNAELEALKADEARLLKEIEGFEAESLSTYRLKVSKVKTYFKRVAPARVAMAERVLQPELLPPLVKICSCESKLRHYDATGRVTRNPVTPDYGLCQINQPTWDATARHLGFDYMQEQGNIIMANIIFTMHGAAPWSATKACHGMA